MRTLTLLYISVLSTSLFSNTYDDRLRIYIDNSFKNFIVQENQLTSNNFELNHFMMNYDVRKIDKWLKNSTPSDRDGEIYLNRYYEIHFDSKSDYHLDIIISELEKLNVIDHVEEINIFKIDYTPNDPLWNQQYYMSIIEADDAFDYWNIASGDLPGSMESGEMIVGVPDNGFQWDHPDLVGNVWKNLGEDADGDGVVIVQNGGSWEFDPGDENGIDDDGDGYIDNFIGWDYSFNDNDPTPINSSFDHGTLVGGCVSASTNNNLGIASVGWSVKLLGINASDDDEVVSDGAEGVLAAAQMGANVINMSWGSSGTCNTSLNSFYNNIYNNYGAIIVSSAGNGDEDGNTTFVNTSPSSCEKVVCVTATGPGDNFGCWAHAGTTVDLCAPGENIRTTDVNSGYGVVSGTSFASPIAAGAIALLWSKFPNESQDWIVDRIISNTDQFPDMEASCNAGSLAGMLGSGRLNINKAISAGSFPSLYVAGVNYLNDSDGDGIFNPGEQVMIKLIVGNEAGWANGENVVATLSTNDDRINIIDDTIEFSNIIPSGGSSFTLIDHFLVQSIENALVGPVSCNVNIQAGTNQTTFYQTNVDIEVNISIDQAGFDASNNYNFKSSPIVFDLNGDGQKEIIVGDEDGVLHGFQSSGDSFQGFPFYASDKIRSSPAVGDINDDGLNEIAFGTYDGKLYILGNTGDLELMFAASGNIIGSPSLADLDNDNDLEIVFVTSVGNDNGDIYAIHHDGSVMDNFPISLNGKMLVGPALGDIENDNIMDIIVCAWDEKIYAFDYLGNMKPGFPFVSTFRFNTPATLVDLDFDGDLEIIAGNDLGKLHVLHHDGSEMATFDTGDDIRGGISVGDINDDGVYEILFSGYDDMVHVWDPLNNVEVQGWPFNMSSNSLTEPLTADLDGDGDLEIIATKKSGVLYVLHHNGELYNDFPMNVSGLIEATPAIADIDGDSDYEIILPTTLGLKVIDIKSEKGNRDSWKLYRCDNYRSGHLSIAQVSNIHFNDIIPNKFFVSHNYPNPFNPMTMVDIHTASKLFLSVRIFDVNGRIVKTLYNQDIDAGFHHFDWDGRDFDGRILPTGVYFLNVQSGSNFNTQKMILIK